MLIRAPAPDCLIVIDGIQHASHGKIDIASYDADGYAVSPCKVFSRHGYGIEWASDRLTATIKETAIGGAATSRDQRRRQLCDLFGCDELFKVAGSAFYGCDRPTPPHPRSG